MSSLGIALLIAALVWLAGWTAIHLRARSLRNDPGYQAEIARADESYAAEEAVREEASWFGSTGLPDDIERDLPKYLRREFGELFVDEGSLKAGDLTYLGRFTEGASTVHYWRVPDSSGEECFAYVRLAADGSTSTGWGDRKPPASRAEV